MVAEHDRVVLVNDPEPGIGWASGVQTCPGTTLELLAEAAPVTTLAALPTGVVTIAFTGCPETGLPWGADAWRGLGEAVAGLSPAGGQLLLRGHHEHILADAPACLRWLDHCDDADLSCGIALSPASMLAFSMIEARDDHVTRMFEYLGPRCNAVIIEDVIAGEDGTIQGCTMGKGLLRGSLLGTLLDVHVPGDVPLVVQASDPEQAHGWLWPV